MPRDPFEILGLAPTFDLTPAQVERAYLMRMAAAHPDAAGDAVGDEDELAAGLNEARATLIDPERRALAVLARLGGPGPEVRALPAGFLPEIMGVREEVEAELGSGNAEARPKWREWVAAKRLEYASRVGGLLARGDATSLREARVQLNAWRYIERLAEQLEPGYDPSRADFGRL